MTKAQEQKRARRAKRKKKYEAEYVSAELRHKRFKKPITPTYASANPGKTGIDTGPIDIGL